MILQRYIDFVNEEKANFPNKNYDRDGFPQVDNLFMQISKASRVVLKELCRNRKIDDRGTKKQLITRLLQARFGVDKVSGYYNKSADSNFKYIQKGENTAGAPRSYENNQDA